MATDRHSLLFVDDEPEVLNILRGTFEDDHDVLTASSGPEALELLAGHSIDLLVTDQRMPRMTGVQLIEKARELVPDLVSIILTAYTDPPDLIEAINRGQVYRFITKPWEIQDIILTVDSALEGVRLRRENAKLLENANNRLAALEVVHSVTRAAATGSTYRAIIDTATALLENVLPLDLSATLLRPDPAAPGTLTLRCNGPITEEHLQQVRERVIRKFAEESGETLSDDQVMVRITGRRTGESSGGGPPTLERQRFVPMLVSGRIIGLLCVFASGDVELEGEDARVLEILADQIAESIEALRTKLGAERQRMRRMVEGMADGVIMTDADGEVVVVNVAARTLLGVPEGQSVTSRFMTDQLGFYPFELVRGWERRGQRQVSEDLIVGERVLHSVISPVTDPDGRLAGVVVVLRDVTEARHLERRKEEFVSLISHELRTPLTSITGSLDLILNGLLGEITEKQERYLGLAKSSADRLNRIVDDLLDLSKLASGKLTLDLNVESLDELVRKTIERYEPVFQKRGLEVVFRGSEGQARAVIDADRMDQVLNNLLTNAIKFTPDDGRVEIEVFAESEVTGTVGFSIWNTGAEIPRVDLERIFEQFEQSSAPSAGRVRGTGLGLPICRSIVEAHGGRIWAETTSGRGARFVVTLPLGTVEDPEKNAAVPADGARGVRVLLVDDDRATSYALKGILLSGGYDTEVAHSAEEALTVARRRRPTMMVIDVRMPGVDGVRLIEILSNDPDTRGVPVLAISGAEEGTRAMKAGAAAFLSKPIQAPELLAAVESLTTHHRDGRRVLVVDDDDALCEVCSDTLTGLGYDVALANNAAQFREQMAAFRPDLVLLDVVLPDGDGFSLLEELKADRATSFTSVIVMSGQTDTGAKVRTLRLGGDDYLLKPFDAMTLAGRVETVMRRRGSAPSPTTSLPGGAAIEAEVRLRLESGEGFALCYLELDALRSFHDYYGYAKAEAVIRQTGDLFSEVLTTFGSENDLLGHISGDDFALLTTIDRVDEVSRKAIEVFDRIIPLYYNSEDRQRGFIEVAGPSGDPVEHPIMSLRVVAVVERGGTYKDHAEMAVVATGLKKRAQAVEGSVYLRDDASSQAAG